MMPADEKTSSRIQAHIFYSGTVQGVGFRFTVQRYARELNLAGWVRNVPDGRVEILAEGPQEKIQRFDECIAAHFEGYIRNKEIESTPAQEKLKGFRIII